MSAVVYHNGKYVAEKEATVPITTHALHYGTGVFEGIRAYYQKDQNALFIFRLEDHFKRMEQNAKLLSLTLPHQTKILCRVTIELVKRNFSKADLYIRPLVYKNDRAVGNFTLTSLSNGFSIFTVPLGRHFTKEQGIAAMISSWERVSDRAIPPRGKITGAYVNTCLAKTESTQKGFDEAIFLNREGHVAEASSENVFIVKNQKVITPKVTDDILVGITRDTVITLAKEQLHLTVLERSITKKDLYLADEILLTGTGAEITPVTSVDRKIIRDGKIGPVSQKVKDLYNSLIHGKYHSYKTWLTKVTK